MTASAPALARSPETRVPYGPRLQVMLVAVMLLVWIVAAVDKLVVFLLVDLIRQDFGVSDFQMSFVLSTAFGVAYALGGLPFGYLADRVDRRKQIFFALLAWSCFSIACGFAGGFFTLLLMRALVGLAESAYPPARDSMVPDAVPEARLGLVNAVMTSGGVIGGGIALLLGGLVTGWASSGLEMNIGGLELRSWQLVFIITGATGFILLPLLLFLPEPARAVRTKAVSGEASGFGAYLRHRWRFYLGAIGAAGMLSTMSNGATAWAPAYLNRTFGMSMMEAGITLGAVQTTAILVGFFASGWAIDRLHRRGRRGVHLKWTLAATLIGTPFGMLAFVLPSSEAFIACIWIFNAIHLAYAVALISVLQIETPSQYRGRVAALYYLIITIVGFGVGPTLVAAVTDFVLGNDALVGRSVMIVAAVMGVGTALSLLLALGERQRVAVAGHK